MREILALRGLRTGAGPRPEIGDAERKLAGADAELARAVGERAPLDTLFAAYERLCAARADVAARLSAWPPAAVALTSDFAYDSQARSLNGDGVLRAELEEDARRFVHDHLLTWRNTNLRKYVQSRIREERG